MRSVHPLWRGFFLACVLTAALVLTGGPDWLSALRGSIPALTFAVMTAAGALLAELPGLLRRFAGRKQKGQTMPAPPDQKEKEAHENGWKRLVTCFLCGTAMSLACGMAGSGRILPALAEGSSGAFAFLGTAAAAALLTARIAGGRAAA